MSEAATVAEAMSALVRRPQWILLDLLLPDGCGVGVLRAVKDGGLPCAVCVITGCGPAMLDAVRALEPEHVMSKPVDVERLMGLLKA